MWGEEGQDEGEGEGKDGWRVKGEGVEGGGTETRVRGWRGGGECLPSSKQLLLVNFVCVGDVIIILLL